MDQESKVMVTTTREFEATWQQIGRLMESGDLPDLLHVGDVLPIRMTTFGTMNFAVASVWKEGAAMVSTDCGFCNRMYRENAVYKTGWMKSSLREILHNEVLKTFPPEVMDLMVPKRIMQRVNGCIEESNDYLWIPSFTELFGVDEDGKPYPTDGEDELHLSLFATEQSRVKMRGHATAEYWTRTPAPIDKVQEHGKKAADDMQCFVTVNESGSDSFCAAAVGRPYAIAFNIGRKKKKTAGKDKVLTANDYQQKAMKFASDLSKATKHNLLLQGVMGMCGEAGETIDIVKKIVFHGHPYDEETREHIAKEIGDVLWYVATAAEAIGYPLETIMQMNIDKLSARYGDHFTTEASMHRKEGDI